MFTLSLIIIYNHFSPTAPGDNQTEQEGNLMDHSDLHVLDLGKVKIKKSFLNLIIYTEEKV